MDDASDRPPGPDTHRVEGFSDAVFAIVITLLVLDLRLPEAPERAGSLGASLVALWPVALAYIISFVNIYILWVSHHELMRITTRFDTRFLYLNGCLLIGVAVMPFSTSVLSDSIESEDATPAAILFTGVLLWVSLWFNLIWVYLSTKRNRLIASVTSADRRRISRTQTATLILYGAAFVLSWLVPLVSILITVAVAVFLAAIDRLSGFASEDVANKDP